MTVEDWFDRVTGKTWRDSWGNRERLGHEYQRRRERSPHALPDDDEVVVIQVHGARIAVHQTELHNDVESTDAREDERLAEAA